MTRWPAGRIAAAAAAVALVATGAGCGGDDGPDAPDPATLAGTWDVSLIVGLADGEPGAEEGFPTESTFHERWVFENCDDTGCLLRRPDGGFVLGDLDRLRVELGQGLGLAEGDQLRFIGEGEAATPLPADADDAGPCDGSAALRWSVRLEVAVRDGILSGSVFRPPEARQVDVDGVTCFGLDLTMGLSGTPAR